jgi:hypothetical protein
LYWPASKLMEIISFILVPRHADVIPYAARHPQRPIVHLLFG